MNSAHCINKIHAFHKKLTIGWKKARCAICRLYFHKLRKHEVSMKQCLCSPLLCIVSEAKKRCRYRIKSSPDSVKPVRQLLSKLGGKTTNELERMRRKGDNWSTNDLFKFQHGNFGHYNIDERRAICMEWLRRLSNITKKYCCLAWYASAIYTCYYRLAPLISDKEEKKRTWTDVKREYAEIFLMGRRIWRRPTHPTRLRILYDLAMLCVLFNDIPNDETIMLFRDLLDDNDNFNFEVLDEIEYAQSIDKAVQLENHVIDLFYQRRKSTCSARSSFLSKSSTDTPRSSFRRTKLRKGSCLSIPDNVMAGSCTTTGILVSRNASQITRKQSVRFAGKPDMNPKEETETDKYQNSVTMKVKGANSDIMDNNDAEKDVTNAQNETNGQFIIANAILTEINEVDVETTAEKK
uniref:Protein kinase domain-containing protein n=1 Tax=Elaeophora elaphi TaxID=1147741 RepID=A0A0R3RVX8_9BILA